jgi:hypothetical protein
MNRRFAVVPASVAAGAAIAVGVGFAAGAGSGVAHQPAPVAHGPQATLVKPFVAYGDKALYDLVPGGSFSPKATDWSLSGSAQIVANNDLAAKTGAHALSLASGATATSAAFPGGDVRTVRLFVENLGAKTSSLRVSATVDENGQMTQVPLGTIEGGSLAPTPIMTLPKSLQVQLTQSDAPLRITVSSAGQSSHWLVKDVYVDPYIRCC